MSGIPASVLEVLQQAEPESTFEESGAHIQSSTGRLYLVKSTATAGEQYHGEAASLRLLGQAAPGLVPRLFGCFDKDGKTHFVSEFLSLNPGLSPTSTDDLANRLASEVHRFGSQNGKYGFQVPTYCGATRLSNGWFDTWDACFASLVRELLAYLRTKGPAYRVLCERGEAVCEIVIPKVLGKLDIQPVLLHGDLWSGNVGTLNRRAAIFDAASYFGHNEADLAIGRMFGGFGSAFYGKYHSIMPKSEPVDEYDDRINLYQMFHYLNHAVLFGEGYHDSAMNAIQRALTKFG